nr:alpha/beta hydrolase [Pseudopedobacter sp.]
MLLTLCLILLLILLLPNLIVYFHAYKFTHYKNINHSASINTGNQTLIRKMKLLFLGIDNPRPQNKLKPKGTFETLKIKSNVALDCWLIKSELSKGTVILFHGYNGAKSLMIEKAEVFISLGYHTLLVDFMGSGESESNQTTIGFYEAEEVKTTFEYIKKMGEKNIILFGTSMGAAAIMKAENDYHLSPSAIIIECPFGSMLESVRIRFKKMNLPHFPLANLLVFWGGLLNGFNAFKHNPSEYARTIKTPTLIIYGKKDDKVSQKEINDIFTNLKGSKTLQTYPLAGHDNYLLRYKPRWTADIRSFLFSTHIK